jgi:hypothetical protein
MGWSVDAWKRQGPLVPDLLDVDTASAPARSEWDKLAAEMDADPDRRMLISHEYVSQVDNATAQRIVHEIGARIHVCITLRAPGQIVPSLWSQGIRDDAVTEPFNRWLARVYATNPDDRLPDRFQRAYDQGELVERWANLVGPENVTVIVADKSEPRLLSGAFEAMLGLPAGTLDWKLTNRSLIATEAELFRHVNVSLRDSGTDWFTFYNLVRKGAIRYGPERRKLSLAEPRVLLPPWAAEIADKDGRRFADSIRRSEVRVVGDLDKLAAESPTAEWQDIESIPIAIAANGVVGAVSAAQQTADRFRRKTEFQAAEIARITEELASAKSRPEQAAELERIKKELAEAKSRTLGQHARSIAPSKRVNQVVAAFSTRELAAALRRRVIQGLGKRLNMPHRKKSL